MTGVDTVGGVRIPAGYCGILGFRPSLGAVSHGGIIPISTSLDTVGMYCENCWYLSSLNLNNGLNNSQNQISGRSGY